MCTLFISSLNGKLDGQDLLQQVENSEGFVHFDLFISTSKGCLII